MTRTTLLRHLPTIAAVLLLIGCLGTWVSVDPGVGSLSSSLAGTETDDGKLLIGFSVVLIAGTLLARRRWMWAIVLVVALLAAAIAVYDVFDVGSETVFGLDVSAGWGLYLCVLASLACLGASLYRLIAQPRAGVARSQPAVPAA